MFVVFCAGCGGGGNSAIANLGGGGSVPKTEAGLGDEVKTFAQDLFTKKLTAADIYASYSKRCKAIEPFSKTAGEYMLGMGMIETFYGKNPTIGQVEVTNFTGAAGTVTLEIISSKGDVVSKLGEDPTDYVYEDGHWRVDSGCEAE